MPSSDRPRTTIEALFEHPLIGSDNGEQGIGPTLGEDVGSPPSASSRPLGERPTFAPSRRTLASTAAHAPLGSEIFRASRGFRAGGLRAPSAVAPVQGAAAEGGRNEQADARLKQARAQSGKADEAGPDPTRAAETKASLNADDGL